VKLQIPQMNEGEKMLGNQTTYNLTWENSEGIFGIGDMSISNMCPKIVRYGVTGKCWITWVIKDE
jgi:hypothetical protein